MCITKYHRVHKLYNTAGGKHWGKTREAHEGTQGAASVRGPVSTRDACVGGGGGGERPRRGVPGAIYKDGPTRLRGARRGDGRRQAGAGSTEVKKTEESRQGGQSKPRWMRARVTRCSALTNAAVRRGRPSLAWISQMACSREERRRKREEEGGGGGARVAHGRRGGCGCGGGGVAPGPQGGEWHGVVRALLALLHVPAWPQMAHPPAHMPPLRPDHPPTANASVITRSSLVFTSSSVHRKFWRGGVRGVGFWTPPQPTPPPARCTHLQVLHSPQPTHPPPAHPTPCALHSPAGSAPTQRRTLSRRRRWCRCRAARGCPAGAGFGRPQRWWGRWQPPPQSAGCGVGVGLVGKRLTLSLTLSLPSSHSWIGSSSPAGCGWLAAGWWARWQQPHSMPTPALQREHRLPMWGSHPAPPAPPCPPPPPDLLLHCRPAASPHTHRKSCAPPPNLALQVGRVALVDHPPDGGGDEYVAGHEQDRFLGEGVAVGEGGQFVLGCRVGPQVGDV